MTTEKSNGVFITSQNKLAKESMRLLLRKPTFKEKYLERNLDWDL